MTDKKFTIIVITITILVLALIVGVCLVISNCCGGGSCEFDTVSWVSNPANPGSPVHQILP